MKRFKSVYFEWIILLLILLFGFILLIHKLEQVPMGLYVDEALSGYNAYSILTTGKDEYGKSWPIAFRFFGTYTPPLYVYLTSLAVKIFDLNIFSTRIVSVLSGVFSALVAYLYLRQSTLIENRKKISLIGALLFVIAPWSILFSRSGYEANLGMFIFSLAIYLFWKAIQNPRFLAAAFFVVSLSTYTAHSEFFLTPLLILGLLVLFYQDFLGKPFRIFLYIGVTIFILIQIPHLYLLSTKALFVKNDLFYQGELLHQASKADHYLPYWASLVLAFLREFTAKYLSYFSPKSLFYLPNPDPQRSLPELSVFYPWMIVPYLVGIYVLFKSLKNKESRFLLLITAIIPIPAALSGDPFATYRVLPLLFPLIIIISLGLDRLINRVKVFIWLPVLAIIIFFSLVMLWRSFFVLLPKERAQIWGDGFPQLADEIRKKPDEKFIIDQNRIKPAYIEMAFFLKYPPSLLQQTIDPKIKENYYNETQFNPNYSFGNMEIRNIDWQRDIYKSQVLVGDELAISKQQANGQHLIKVFEIFDPLGFPIFQGYKTNPLEKCRSINNQNKFCYSLPE